MVSAFVLSQIAALPDALLALWLMLLGKGVVEHSPALVQGAATGLGVSTALTWFLRTVSTRIQRRFRDKVTIALESHVAQLQAIGRDGGASGTPGIPRPAVHAAQSGLRARPHVHVAVYDARMDPAAGHHDGAADVDSPGASSAARVCDPDDPDILLAARGGKDGAGTGGAGQSAGAASFHHRHDSASRQRSAGHRYRRAADDATSPGLEALV